MGEPLSTKSPPRDPIDANADAKGDRGGLSALASNGSASFFGAACSALLLAVQERLRIGYLFRAEALGIVGHKEIGKRLQ